MMDKRRKHEFITEKCEGCVKAGKTLCKVIKEPKYFFEKYGECFSRSEDPEFFEQVKKQVEEYKEGGGLIG